MKPENVKRAWVNWRFDEKPFASDGSEAKDEGAPSVRSVPFTQNLAGFFNMSPTSLTKFVRTTSEHTESLYPLIRMDVCKEGKWEPIWLMQSYDPLFIIPTDQLELVRDALREKTPHGTILIASRENRRKKGVVGVDGRVIW